MNFNDPSWFHAHNLQPRERIQFVPQNLSKGTAVMGNSQSFLAKLRPPLFMSPDFRCSSGKFSGFWKYTSILVFLLLVKQNYIKAVE